MSFNVYINSFNRVDTLQNLVTSIQSLEELNEIVIYDNASTRQETKDLLSTLEGNGVCVVHSQTNDGPRGAFHYAQQKEDSFFVITDGDLDISSCPKDLLSILRNGLIQYPDIVKAGLSLCIEDIPEDLPYRSHIINGEETHWQQKQDDFWYLAPIDSTFTMCRPNQPFAYAPAIRAAPPYTARHTPWYMATEDDIAYLANLPHTHRTGLSWSTITASNLKSFTER